MAERTMVRSWVVALEVDEDPEGPDLDVKAVARGMDAVAGIHPSPRGGRRHSFLVRLDGNDPADALVAAVARFRQAPVNGGALLGARVVRPSGTEEAPSARRRAILRPRILAAIACALLGIAALLALVPRGGDSTKATLRSTAGSSSSSSSGGTDINLLGNGSFELAAVKPKGLARGATAWGAADVALVDSPVKTGKRAQRLAVRDGQLGGVWFEVPATEGAIYEQSGWVQVQTLSPGSRAELIIEWYGVGGNLVDYRALPITATDTEFVRRMQTVPAPPGAVRARFLVNFTRGGSLVIDDADLHVTASAPATAITTGPSDPAQR